MCPFYDLCLYSLSIMFSRFVHVVASVTVRHSFLTVAAAAAKSLQSCPTLCDPIDGSQPGSPFPGILQARTLEWVAISVSNAWKWIQFYDYATVCLSANQLMDIGLFPPFGTFVYKFLFEHPFSVLLSIYPGVEFVGHIGILGLPYWGTSRLFSRVATAFHTRISHVPISPDCHQHFLFVLFCFIHP